MILPNDVKEIIEYIESNGYEAYLVGGSVRDSLLDIACKDYDIATSATPTEMKEMFSFTQVKETGLQHGTLTLIINQAPYEVTTFRADGVYNDYRRPSKVTFSRNLKEDLQRRDFTINAIAFHPTKGYIDPFDGIEDLQRGILRAVGDPFQRLEEDPLRILRGLRFISRFGLLVEANTKKALSFRRDLLFFIAKERIYSELKGILIGPHIDIIIDNHFEILVSILPELSPMENFEIPTGPILTHIKGVLMATEPTPSQRLSALLHDISKPQIEVVDGKYPDHAKLSDKIATKILMELKVDNKTAYETSQIIRYHSVEIEPTETAIKEWLQKLGEHLFIELLKFKSADAYDNETKLSRAHLLQKLTIDILYGKKAYKLSHLAINGNDLQEIGITEGRTIGLILDALLKEVIREKIPNEKQALIDRAFQLK